MVGIYHKAGKKSDIIIAYVLLSLYIINVEFKYEIESILFTTIVFKERKTNEVVNK